MSRAATANRYNTRVSGQFTSTATLRAQQRALLAPSSRWRKEWVRPESSSSSSSIAANKGSEKPSSSSGNTTGGGYRVLKWVKYDEGGELAEEGEQPTEEQVTAAITGAKTLLEPEPAPAPTPTLEPTATTAGSTSPAENVETAPVTEGNTPAPAAPPSSLGPSQQKDPSTVLAASPGSSPAVHPPPTTTAPAFAPSPLKEQQLPAADNGEAMALSDSDGQIVQPQEKQVASLTPGREDNGGDMVVEAEQREHDVRMAPELVGEEAAATRAALGISDPVGGGPPEVTG